MTTTNNAEKTELQKAAAEVLTKVTLPLTLARVLQAGIIHLVGRKVFPTVFTGFGRTIAVTYLVRLITDRPKPTPEMKKISEDYIALTKTAR